MERVKKKCNDKIQEEIIVSERQGVRHAMWSNKLASEVVTELQTVCSKKETKRRHRVKAYKCSRV